MRVHKLGHAVLKVRSLEVSVPFYRDVLGLAEVARYGSHMAFFSCGESHHDLGLLEVGAQAAPPVDRQVGLYHLAFKVGESLDELRACRDHLAAHGVKLAGSPITASASRCTATIPTASSSNCMSTPIRPSGAMTPAQSRTSGR